jgi:cytochrome c biogenesis protein CcdA
MNDDEKKQKNGPVMKTLMVVVGLFLLAVFFGFFVLWAREGWSAATRQNPVGGAMFMIVLGFVYVAAIPTLKDKGHRGLANAMLWIALAAGGAFIAGFLPSCSGSSSDFQQDRPYRK